MRRRHGHDRRYAFVTRFDLFADFSASDAFDFEMRRLKFVVRDDDDRHAVAQFDFGDTFAFFVKQKVGDAARDLHQHLPGVLLHRLFFDEAKHGQRQRFDAAHAAMAFADRGHADAEPQQVGELRANSWIESADDDRGEDHRHEALE